MKDILDTLEMHWLLLKILAADVAIALLGKIRRKS